MQYILTKFKIKAGKKDTTQEFLSNIHLNHKDNMIQVLDEAGISLDCSFIEGNYLYIFKRLDSLEILEDKISNSTLPIYEDIRKWAEECLEERNDIESIAAFDVFDK